MFRRPERHVVLPVLVGIVVWAGIATTLGAATGLLFGGAVGASTVVRMHHDRLPGSAKRLHTLTVVGSVVAGIELLVLALL